MWEWLDCAHSLIIIKLKCFPVAIEVLLILSLTKTHLYRRIKRQPKGQTSAEVNRNWKSYWRSLQRVIEIMNRRVSRLQTPYQHPGVINPTTAAKPIDRYLCVLIGTACRRPTGRGLHNDCFKRAETIFQNTKKVGDSGDQKQRLCRNFPVNIIIENVETLWSTIEILWIISVMGFY